MVIQNNPLPHQTVKTGQRGLTPLPQTALPTQTAELLANTPGPYTLETSRFGQITVNAEQVWSFVLPLVGFDHVSDYVLLEHAPDSPFYWLQAIQDPDLAFVTTAPAQFGHDYSVTIPEWALELLGTTHTQTQSLETLDSQFTILTLVTIPEDAPRNMTANLLAPIILFRQHEGAPQLGMQLVLQDTSYSTRTRLLPDTP